MKKLVYDFGMNNGDDVDYYLKKGFDVIGIEANPRLCNQCSSRFEEAIASGRLKIECLVVSSADDGNEIPFYIHRSQDALSQMAKPSAERLTDFECIMVRQQSAATVVKSHGTPYYIKLDIEGSDEIALRSLFAAGIMPDFISAETQSINIFAQLVVAGYQSFNIVDGRDLASKYRDAEIDTPSGRQRFSFRNDSSGPCAEDIRSEWLDPDSFFYRLATERLDAWKDIHASRVVQGRPARHEVTRVALRRHLIDFIPSIRRAVVSRLVKRT